jgi:AcrR family transcriptional regulator
VPRAGLDAGKVTAAAAALADEVGLPGVTMGALAERLSVKAPSLYKHVAGQAELQQRIAVLAVVELGDTLRDAIQGRSGRDALTAAAQAVRRFVVDHPGRYAATIRITGDPQDEPLAAAGARVLESLAAVLSAYDLEPADTVHALRMLRSVFTGFAVLEAAGGFQLDTDVDESFAWLVDFVDQGLTSRPRPRQ